MSEVPTRRLINGVGLHVEPVIGGGELLVLVHGGWTDHHTWAPLAPLLARSFRVVSYDRRGHSLSERGGGPALRRQDEDDLAALIELLGAPAHVVGSSYGGSIALGLAGRRPDLIRGLVAHEPPLVDMFSAPPIKALIETVQDQIAAGDVEGGTRRFFEGIAAPGAWDMAPEPIRRAAVANAQTFLDLREDPEWATLDTDAVSRFPGRLVISHGDAGPIWLPRIAVSVADVIRREPSVIHGADHTPHHTQPEAFAALIEQRLHGRTLARAA